jgi:hypothetical protein
MKTEVKTLTTEQVARIMSENIIRRLQREKYYNTREELLASAIARMAPETRMPEATKFLSALHAKDAAYFMERNNGAWLSVWVAFEHATGIKLPKTQKGIAAAMRSWIGEQRYDEADAARIAERDRKLAESDAAWRERCRKHQERLELDEKRIRWIHHGAEKLGTVREWIQDIVATGFTQIIETKRGALQQWKIANSNGEFFFIRKKFVADFAKQYINSQQLHHIA